MPVTSLALLATCFSLSFSSSNSTSTSDGSSSFPLTWILVVVTLISILIIGTIIYLLRKHLPCCTKRKSVKDQPKSEEYRYLRKTTNGSFDSLNGSAESLGSSGSSGSIGSAENAQSDIATAKKRSRTMSNSIEEDVTSPGVKFINRRGDLALPFLTKEIVKKIEKSMKSPRRLPGFTTVEKGLIPTIKEVFTFSTSDDITLLEEIQPKRKNFLGITVNGSNRPPTLDEKELFLDLIRNGPRQFPFSRSQMKAILRRGKEIFQAEPSLLEAAVPATVYGDIHGQYSDLLRWLNLNGFPNETRCVFLGDFVDRGPHGVEVIMIIVLMKLIWPQNVFVCRGNHEEESLNKNYSFFDEVQLRFPPSVDLNEKCMFSYFSEMFAVIPLAVLIGGQILGMHGGISPKLMSLQDIIDIERPIVEFLNGTLACDLVWSDPATASKRDVRGFKPNLEREPTAGIGQLFGKDAVRDICDRVGVSMIIRGHQAPLHGYSLFADNQMITLFSAPGYKGKCPENTNMGASLIISDTLEITIRQIEVSENYRMLRMKDLEKRKGEAHKRAELAKIHRTV